MASERAIAIQRAAAVDRIAAALTVLGDRFGIDADPNLLTPAGARYDPALGHAQQLTAMAGILEQIQAATTPQEASHGREAIEGHEGGRPAQSQPKTGTATTPAKKVTDSTHATRKK